MKGIETKGSHSKPRNTPAKPVAAPYRQVFDARKQRVRGLWKRGEAFYARFLATDHDGRARDTFRSLEGVTTVPAAKAALEKLRTEASKRSIPTDGRCPLFAEFGARYLSEVSAQKRPATFRKERAHIAWWTARLGAFPINRIHRTHVNAGVAALTKSGLSPRTANLYTIALRLVLKRGLEEGLIHELPTAGLRPLKVATKKRALVEMATFDAILGAAGEATKNAVQFRDYLRFLLFTGAREQEALRVAWADIDFENGQVTIGADGLSKNHEARRVDFNPNLSELLHDMKARRAPDSQWLFPSPQRGQKDIPAKTFRESLRLAAAAAGVGRIGFHDCRHHFVSAGVMNGIDFMTLASWVGHKDGGVLVGRIYGHLAGGHRKVMAKRMTLKSAPAENVIEFSASAQ